MKIFLLVFCLIFTCSLHSQLLSKDSTLPQPLRKVDPRYFLATEAMEKRGMDASESVANIHLRRWSALSFEKAEVQIVFDIRYVFSSEQKAADYYKGKLEELREEGEETTHDLKPFGATESNVYGGNPKLLSLFGDMDMNQFNFVFRVKQVIAKVFVSGPKKMTYEQALVFAREAIERIKAVP